MDIAHKIPYSCRTVCIRASFIFYVLLLAHNAALSQPSYTSTWKTDGILLSTGLATILASSVLDKSPTPLTIEELGRLSRVSVNGFDRSATYLYSASLDRWSDVFVGISVISPAGLFLLRDVRSSAGTFSLMYLETILLSAFIPQLCKRSVDRYRPYAYNPAAPLSIRTNPDSRRSFLSGHTTSAFASALLLSTVYSNSNSSSKWKSCVWVGSLLSASVVSYLRYASGAHFPTDILAAAFIGVAIGYLVPALHRSSM